MTQYGRSEERLTVIVCPPTARGDWLHVPQAKGALTDTAVCDAVGEPAVYAADEYDLDDEGWCPACRSWVERDRDFVAMMKDDKIIARAFTDLRLPIPVTLIPSDKPFSLSRDKVYDD